MKLSSHQTKVLKLMQEGWECGIHICTSGHTQMFERGVLQKNGLGHGSPLEEVKAQTIWSLRKHGLIELIPNDYVMTKPTRFVLTQKGKFLQLAKNEKKETE